MDIFLGVQKKVGKPETSKFEVKYEKLKANHLYSVASFKTVVPKKIFLAGEIFFANFDTDFRISKNNFLFEFLKNAVLNEFSIFIVPKLNS